MEITEISPQKNKKNRLNVFIDGKFSFGCSADTLVKFDLHKGKILSSKEIFEIKKKDTEKKALDKAFFYLSRRPHGEEELKEKLLKKGFSLSEINETVKIIKSYGYLNDEEFTEAWIKERKQMNPKGKKALFWELKKKKISEDLIKSKLELVSEDEEVEEISYLLKKKFKNNDFKDRKTLEKAYAYLASRGYDYGTIKKGLKEYLES
ncbi:MAG: RecX family transcriptional regulator [Patescibacteria group bacterium]|nr:RecX family transcriptional regulator [Patescibacteria group bacterium]